ncbi:medium-chain acyl-CoA ligase ACSF2, mitochondrial-like [Ixodes scapularis]|uniref:medium-chain acyl-CoA ligase ACSF2, mitochondrial-like n=1 Tax=Ixodes scapularis TaxID=6945 RepID=UPI001A9CC118|nr:medium-chain acyl-CoA ligase ACSF2, mitochondrial-like [Ixodes scapularis]
MLLQIAPELEKSAPGELKSQRLPFLKHVITIGDTRKPGSITFDDLMTLAIAEDHATMNSVSAKTRFDQDAFIQFSSGTTGQPKPARLSHFNVVNNANIVGRFVGYHKQREIFCLNGQLIYGFGRTLGVLTATMFGSTVVLPGPFFEPKSTMEAITKHRMDCCIVAGRAKTEETARFSSFYLKSVSTASCVNFMTVLLADILGYTRPYNEFEKDSIGLDQLEMCANGVKTIVSGALCNPEVVEKARTRLNTQALYIMYGATETSPIFCSTNPDEPTDLWIRTVGTPLDHVEVKVVDTEGRIVPVNTRGELCTRGPHVFKGYLNDDAKTKEALRENWYHTGDEATMSEDGRITFSGRIKEMINIGSFKVPPLEVESVLNTHPDVEEAQVIGVPDERLGNKICVWIKLQPYKTLSHEDIKTFCKGKIHDYKIPEYVLFVDSFPRTLTGKVQKHKMREESVRLLNLSR